jgi:hypothetical protein
MLASRSRQSLARLGLRIRQLASWTKRNGKSPRPHARRQSRIIAGKSVRYWKAAPALLSPWYQIAPRIESGARGASMAP